MASCCNHLPESGDASSSSATSSSSGDGPVVVGIVGGGIAGLATAVALQARGIECIVFERDSTFDDRHQGYGLTMQQGGRALLRLGLADQVAERACTSSRHCIFDSSGNLVFFWGTAWDELQASRGAETPQEKKQQLVGQHNVHIPRQALRRVLLDALKPNTVRWNSRLISVVQDTEQINQLKPDVKPPVDKHTHVRGTCPHNSNGSLANAKRTCVTCVSDSTEGESKLCNSSAQLPQPASVHHDRSQSLNGGQDLNATPADTDTDNHSRADISSCPTPGALVTNGRSEIQSSSSSVATDTVSSSKGLQPRVLVHVKNAKPDGGSNDHDAETVIPVSLLVACDGIRSSVREQVVGDPLRYLDTLVVLGIFDCTAPEFALFEERIVQMSDGVTRLFMMPFSGHKHKAMWQLSFGIPHDQALALSAQGPAALVQEAVRRCGEWADPIPAILAATSLELVTGYPTYDRDPLNSDWNARDSLVTLAGDAAHPLSPFKGQGANAALCDALTLAECLSKQLHPERYANKRQPWQKERPPNFDESKNKNNKRKKKKARGVLHEFGTKAAILVALREHERLMAQRMNSKVLGSREAVKSLHCGSEFERPEYHARRCNFPASVAELVHCLREEHRLGTWTDPAHLDAVAFTAYARVVNDGVPPRDAVKQVARGSVS
jgi:2-polyprenyl-6-methoxyphenol hydroxylase-like FAD-dependent oxidoreductase